MTKYGIDDSIEMPPQKVGGRPPLSATSKADVIVRAKAEHRATKASKRSVALAFVNEFYGHDVLSIADKDQVENKLKYFSRLL